MVEAGPQISDVNSTEVVIAVVTLLLGMIGRAAQKIRKDFKRSPITQDEKTQADIATGDDKLAYVLGIAQQAEERSKAADERAKKADDRIQCLEGRYGRLVDWAQLLIDNWDSLRRHERPPEIPPDALPDKRPRLATVTRLAERGDATSDRD